MRDQETKNSTGRGRYSKIIREQGEGLLALESVANRLLAEKDAEIARLRRTLEIIAGSPDKLQALQAKAALDNIGPTVTSSLSEDERNG